VYRVAGCFAMFAPLVNGPYVVPGKRRSESPPGNRRSERTLRRSEKRRSNVVIRCGVHDVEGTWGG
jgi:hypothetical protein